MTSRMFQYVVAAGVIAQALPGGAHATSTQAHAMVVSGSAGHPGGGEFDCATSGPQPMEGKYFGSASVGLPTEGYAYCHLAGGVQDTSNPHGISTANQSVTNAFAAGLHTQTATATADFGVLKAASNGSFTGSPYYGNEFHAGEAAAYSTDTLPVPTGAASIQFGLTIDGSASVTGSSQTLTILDYQINGGVIYGAFEGVLPGGNSVGTAQGLTANGTGTGPVAGFTVGLGSLSGAGTVYSFRTDLSGSTFDLTLALLAASYPSPVNSVSPAGGTANDDFAETARLSSLSFFDARGNPLAFGTLTGASGRLYDAAGVHTAPVGGVPEPASWALMIAGFGLVGSTLRRGRVQAA